MRTRGKGSLTLADPKVRAKAFLLQWPASQRSSTRQMASRVVRPPARPPPALCTFYIVCERPLLCLFSPVKRRRAHLTLFTWYNALSSKGHDFNIYRSSISAARASESSASSVMTFWLRHELQSPLLILFVCSRPRALPYKANKKRRYIRAGIRLPRSEFGRRRRRFLGQNPSVALDLIPGASHALASGPRTWAKVVLPRFVHAAAPFTK